MNMKYISLLIFILIFFFSINTESVNAGTVNSREIVLRTNAAPGFACTVKDIATSNIRNVVTDVGGFIRYPDSNLDEYDVEVECQGHPGSMITRVEEAPGITAMKALLEMSAINLAPKDLVVGMSADGFLIGFIESLQAM